MQKLSLEDIKNDYSKYVLDVYSPYEVAFEYGTGELLFDLDGKQYIDFASGISVTNLGHCDSDIIQAINSQVDKLTHTSNLFYSYELARLAKTLIEYSFPGKAFFCNSGTEANELALKLIKKYGNITSREQGIILTLEESFHGRTLGSMSLTGHKSIKTGFGDLIDNIVSVSANDEDDLVEIFERYENNIIGMIVEPIIGEGGIIPLSESFLGLSRKLTLDSNSLLIFDEVQTGIGRTGSLFCFEQFNFLPDAFTLAKGLGSGFPIGAVIISEKYENVLTKSMHGSTFGGNHLATAVAYETIKQIISRNILRNVEKSSNFSFQYLKDLESKFPKIIKDVRGRGLHIGVELSIPSRPIAEKSLEYGLVVNSTAQNVIRIMPPLNISEQFLSKGFQILEKVLNEVI